jgi:ATP synthase subunit 6
MLSGIPGQKVYLFIYAFLFSFLLFCNNLGLLPYTLALTSSLFLTLFFSVTLFIFILITLMLNFKEKFVSIFLPAGTPTIIIPFLVGIEILSYFSRLISLAVRLFANITAGHILLKTLLLAFINILFAKNIFIITNFFLFFVIVGIFVLETFISFLQAYVFITLFNIYLSEVTSISH